MIKTSGNAPIMLPALTRAGLADITPSRPVAVSYLVAKKASEEAAVQGFRNNPESGLPAERLLPWTEELEQWILRHAGLPGMMPALWLKEAPLTREQTRDLAFASTLSDWRDVPDVIVRVPAAEARRYLRPRLLHYGLPGDAGERNIAITVPHGVLDRLRELSKQLAQEYNWMPAQATVFVLTGLVPLVATLSVGAHGVGHVPALGRIVLTIDPTLSPKEVADQYSALRSTYVGPRHRELMDKHLALAMFASTRPDGESWTEGMKEWNALQQDRHSDWRYSVPNNFSRDCVAAQRRLLGQTEPRSGEV